MEEKEKRIGVVVSLEADGRPVSASELLDRRCREKTLQAAIEAGLPIESD